MEENLITYFQEHRKKLITLLKRYRQELGEHKEDRVFKELLSLDWSIEQENTLIGLKNRWRVLKKTALEATADSRDQKSERNSIIKGLLNFLGTILSEGINEELTLPNKTIKGDLTIVKHLEALGEFAKLDFLSKLISAYHSIGLLKGQEHFQGAVLLEDGYILTSSEILKHKDALSKARFQLDYSDKENTQLIEYELYPEDVEGDLEKSFLKIKLKDRLDHRLNKCLALSLKPKALKSDDLLQLIRFANPNQLVATLSLHLFSNYAKDGFSFRPGNEGLGIMLDEAAKLVALQQTEAGRAISTERIEENLSVEKDISSLEEAPKAISQAPEKTETFFGKHHKYTCNRFDQNDAFTTFLASSKASQRLNFFYLHGGEFQSHWGLVKRFMAKLGGKEKDHIADVNEHYAKVIGKNIKFPRSRKKEAIWITLPQLVLKSFGISEPEMQVLSEKHLAFALQCPRSLIHGFSKEEKVCLLIRISERTWDPELIPEVSTWFIEEFCQKGFPEDGPQFFIFFAIEYDDEDHSEIEAEILEALEDAKYTQSLFPALEMVNHDDIEEWFEEYTMFWDYNRRANKKDYKNFFGDQEEEMCMEDVQEILEEVIEKVNQKKF